MITVIVVLATCVVFVFAAAARVSRDARDYDDQRHVDEWIRDLHAEAPHEFVETRITRPTRIPRVVAVGSEGQIQIVPAASIEELCHWVQNRADIAHDQTHEAFHFGYPCPYHVVAEVLRGNGDPREGLPIEVLS